MSSYKLVGNMKAIEVKIGQYGVSTPRFTALRDIPYSNYCANSYRSIPVLLFLGELIMS